MVLTYIPEPLSQVLLKILSITMLRRNRRAREAGEPPSQHAEVKDRLKSMHPASYQLWPPGLGYDQEMYVAEIQSPGSHHCWRFDNDQHHLLRHGYPEGSPNLLPLAPLAQTRKADSVLQYKGLFTTCIHNPPPSTLLMQVWFGFCSFVLNVGGHTHTHRCSGGYLLLTLHSRISGLSLWAFPGPTSLFPQTFPSWMFLI